MPDSARDQRVATSTHPRARRARVAPIWAAACPPIATIVNTAGFGAASRALLAASCLILVVGFGRPAACSPAGRVAFA
jgi:hypothetical protein